MNTQQSRLGLVLVGLLLSLFVSAMDNTIVATAMATIVAHLGGLDKFVWVSSAYMVTEMAGMPIFGKLSDIYGRKRFFIFGMIVFLVGSMLCGTAQNIVQLIIYRAIQGVGGGALAPIAFTILFDVITPQQRGKMGGMFGAVFGLSSIFGPLLGAYITEYVNWRWIFYINVPLGIVAFALIAWSYRESLAHMRQKIDWAGVITLVPAIAALMFALQLGGNQHAWDSAFIIGLFAVAAVLFALFLVIEAKVEEPIVSYQMFRNRLFAGSNLIGLFSGAAYVVAILYIPIFVQGVLGGSATNSGLVLLPMMLGSVVSSQLGAIASNRFSFRSVMVVSNLVFITGIYLLGTLNDHATHLLVTVFMIVTGFGIGASFSVLSMASMQPFGAHQRGTASSTMNFVRELAMTVGITVFGILQRNAFTGQLTTLFAGKGQVPTQFAHMDPRAMLTPETRKLIPDVVLQKLMHALSTSITHTFVWALVPAVLALLCVFFMSKEKLTAPMGMNPESVPQASPEV